MMVLNDAFLTDKVWYVDIYLKKNQGKLTMLGFPISHLTRDHIHDISNAIWCQDTVTYHGIKFTDNINDFIKLSLETDGHLEQTATIFVWPKDD